ncbi:hypothetical protein BH20ACT8_BH20ACT8_12490 [soil metagenome]
MGAGLHDALVEDLGHEAADLGGDADGLEPVGYALGLGREPLLERAAQLRVAVVPPRAISHEAQVCRRSWNRSDGSRTEASTAGRHTRRRKLELV